MSDPSEAAKKAVEEIQSVCVDPKTPFLPHGAAEIIQKAIDAETLKMRTALMIIDHGASDYCTCICGDPGGTFVRCDVCKTKAYEIAHAFGTCRDGCPVKASGIKLVEEAIKNVI